MKARIHSGFIKKNLKESIIELLINYERKKRYFLSKVWIIFLLADDFQECYI